MSEATKISPDESSAIPPGLGGLRAATSEQRGIDKSGAGRPEFGDYDVIRAARAYASVGDGVVGRSCGAGDCKVSGFVYGKQAAAFIASATER